MTIGTFVGSLLVGPLSWKFGRRVGLWGASLLCYISTAIMLGSSSVGALYFARLLLGVSVGWFMTFAQLYVYETSPAHLRAISLGCYQVTLSIGSIIGSAIDKGTSTVESRRAYQIPLAIFFVVPTVLSVCLFFFPESPRWLTVQGRTQDARKALSRLRNSNIDPAQLQAELATIEKSTKEQLNTKGKPAWIEMWCGTNLRRTLLSIAVVCFHSGNGSSWINIYTTYYFTIAGVKDAFSYSILVSCLGFLGVLTSVCFIRYVDRRQVLFWGCLACGLCQLIPAITWSVNPGSISSGKVVVAFIALFTFFYTMYAPYAWLLGGECPNNALRPFTFGVATAANFLFNWLGTFTAPYFINPAELNWSAKYGYIWFGANMIIAAFVFFFVPETRDRTLEEIHEMFEARVPAREFKNYVCEKTGAFAAEGMGQAGALHDDGSRSPSDGQEVNIESKA
jgi:sugar porter (SP) family MFS transporter